MMAVVADDCSGRGVGGICCRRPDCCAPPRPGLWLQVHGHQAFISSAIRQRVCHNLTPYAMSDKPGQPRHQETPPRHNDEAGFSTGYAARAETRSRRHVARRDISRIADISPNGGNTPRRAVAEGFEPPDGVSRLSLSRRVH